jgi:hypothetical protein
VSYERLRAVAGPDFVIPNDLEEVAMKKRLKRSSVEGLKRLPCHVERSETSSITILARCRENNQRFFSRDCGIRMTMMFTAALTFQRFNLLTNV